MTADAATRKEIKDVELSTTNHFIPLAFESLDSIGSKATTFLKELGRHLISIRNGKSFGNCLSVPAPISVAIAALQYNVCSRLLLWQEGRH